MDLRGRGQRLEAKAVDLLLEVPGRKVPVDLGRDARVLVAHDPLDGRQVGTPHEQQRRRRVPQVMEPQLPHLADRNNLKLHFGQRRGFALTAGSRIPV